MKILKHLAILFFLFNFNIGYTQSWDELENEYNVLLENEQVDFQLSKAKEMYSWVKVNESDTSFHLPVSLKLIGNSFMDIYPDSSLAYYNVALELLNKQNRLTNIQTSKIHYNKSKVYALKRNDILELIEIEKSIEILEKLNYPEFPYCVWPLERAAVIYYDENNLVKSRLIDSVISNIALKQMSNRRLSDIYSTFLIGNHFLKLKEYDFSKSIFEKNIELMEDSLDEKYPLYEITSWLLGKSYKKMGKYIEAELYLKKSINLKKIIWGDTSKYYTIGLIGIGDFYHEIGKNKESLEYLLKAIEYYKINLKTLDENYSDCLNTIGNIYSDLDRYDDAEKFYTECLNIRYLILDKFNPDIAISLMNIGNLKREIYDFKLSEEYLLKSKELLNQSQDDVSEIKATLFLNIGALYNELKKYELAEFYLNETLKLSVNENKNTYAKALLNLGNINLENNNYLIAKNYLEEALSIFEINENVNFDGVSIALNSLGILNTNLSNFKEAENCLLKSIEVNLKYTNGQTSEICYAFISLGNLYSDMNNERKAISAYFKSYDLIKKINGEQNIIFVKCLTNLAGCFRRINDYESSETYYNSALEIVLKLQGNYELEYAGLLNDLATLYSDINLLDKSEKFSLKSISAFEQSKNTNSLEYALTLSNLGALYLNNSKIDKALGYFKKSNLIYETKFNSVSDNPNYLNNTLNIGLFYLKNKNYELAEPYYLKILIAIKKNLEDNVVWMSQNEREWYLISQMFYFYKLDNFFATSYEKLPQSASNAFNLALIDRAFLIENNRKFNNDITNYKDSNLISSFNKLKYLRNIISKLSSESKENNLFLLKFESQADSIDRLLSRSMSSFLDFKKGHALTWKNIQLNLSNDAVAIEFVRYYDNLDSAFSYMAIIVKQGDKHPQLVKLCTENELKQYSQETELNTIYDLIWRPLLPSLTNVKTIYYSPVGLLNNIPFQALYKEENGQREYVMDKFTLHQLTSTRYLALDLKKKEQETIEPSIALFGGINYNDYPNAKINTTIHNESTEAAFLYKNAIVLNRELDSTRTGANYLPGTKKEVETIADVLKLNQWQVDVSEGKNATENKIKSLSGNNSKSILHIATHGFAFPDKEEKRKDMAFSMMRGNDKYKTSDNPMIRSGLLFGGANLTWQGKGDSLLNTTNEDGVLTAYELSQLDLSNTKLAVLSACETGKGAIQGSEGTFGLKRALKLAGVDNMIVSLWKVPDDATMEMMTLFYTELANTKKPVSSFETAQKAMRLRYPNEPKKWAGFVFVR
jgi:CHAT domain-containing protein